MEAATLPPLRPRPAADEAQFTARPESPLAQLARIRQMLDKMDLLIAERDRLIREAVTAERYSQRQIGSAAGVSQTRVYELAGGRKYSLRQGAAG